MLGIWKRLDQWFKDSFDRYYKQSLYRSRLFWLLTALIAAMLIQLAMLRTLLPWTPLVIDIAMLIGLWGHLHVQHRRISAAINGNREVNASVLGQVAWGLFAVITVLLLALGTTLGHWPR